MFKINNNEYHLEERRVLESCNYDLLPIIQDDIETAKSMGLELSTENGILGIKIPKMPLKEFVLKGLYPESKAIAKLSINSQKSKFIVLSEDDKGNRILFETDADDKFCDEIHRIMMNYVGYVEIHINSEDQYPIAVLELSKLMAFEKLMDGAYEMFGGCWQECHYNAQPWLINKEMKQNQFTREVIREKTFESAIHSLSELFMLSSD